MNKQRQKQFDLNEPVTRLSIHNTKNKEVRLLVSKVNELSRKFNILFEFIKSNCNNKQGLTELIEQQVEQHNDCRDRN